MPPYLRNDGVVNFFVGEGLFAKWSCTPPRPPQKPLFLFLVVAGVFLIRGRGRKQRVQVGIVSMPICSRVF